jgi:hypothetical protein
MAFPSTGNGYQTTDGNVNEITLAIQGAPATVSAAGTLTAAQLLTGLIVASGTPGTQTLPTVALLEAALPNVKVDSGFNLNLINTAGSTATVATGTVGRLWARQPLRLLRLPRSAHARPATALGLCTESPKKRIGTGRATAPFSLCTSTSDIPDMAPKSLSRTRKRMRMNVMDGCDILPVNRKFRSMN